MLRAAITPPNPIEDPPLTGPPDADFFGGYIFEDFFNLTTESDVNTFEFSFLSAADIPLEALHEAIMLIIAEMQAAHGETLVEYAVWRRSVFNVELPNWFCIPGTNLCWDIPWAGQTLAEVFEYRVWLVTTPPPAVEALSVRPLLGVLVVAWVVGMIIAALLPGGLLWNVIVGALARIKAGDIFQPPGVPAIGPPSPCQLAKTLLGPGWQQYSCETIQRQVCPSTFLLVDYPAVRASLCGTADIPAPPELWPPIAPPPPEPAPVPPPTPPGPVPPAPAPKPGTQADTKGLVGAVAALSVGVIIPLLVLK